MLTPQCACTCTSILCLSMTCCHVCIVLGALYVAEPPCPPTGVSNTCSLHRITVELATKTVHLGQMKLGMPILEEFREAFVKVSNSVAREEGEVNNVCMSMHVH